MADIINLRRARKAKARDTAESQAEANRAKFGRTKEEKAAKKAEDRRAQTTLDQHRLMPKDETRD